MAKNNNLLLVGGAAAVALFAFSGGSKKKSPPKEDSPDTTGGEDDTSSDPSEGPGIEGSDGYYGGYDDDYDYDSDDSSSKQKISGFNVEMADGVALVAANASRQNIPAPHGNNLANALGPMIQRGLPIWLALHANRKKSAQGAPLIDFPSKVQYEVSEFLKANWNVNDLGLPNDPAFVTLLNQLKSKVLPPTIMDAKQIAFNLNKKHKIPWDYQKPAPSTTMIKGELIKAAQKEGARSNSESVYIMFAAGLLLADKSLSGVMKKALPLAVESAINKALSGTMVPSAVKKPMIDKAKSETKKAIDKAAKASKLDHIDDKISDLMDPILSKLPSSVRSKVQQKIDENLVKAINSLVTKTR